MQKVIVFGLAFILCAVLVVGCFAPQDTDTSFSEDVLRIHIRANSNGEKDQKVKYEVKNAVTEFLTPLLVGATDKEKARKIIQSNLDEISALATAVLEKNGFAYGAKASLCKESFPTRHYEELTLPAGEYDALILNLGEAEGDNWWCVVYPPLCFVVGYDVAGNAIVYQSKLKEIIEKFFNQYEEKQEEKYGD